MTAATAAASAVRSTGSAGSAPVGSARYAYPAGARFVSTQGWDGGSGTAASPWRTVGRAIAGSPSGSTLVLRAGVYHENVTIPGGRQLTVQAYPGEPVWFDGSSPVTNWVASGGVWRSDRWTPRFDYSPTYTSGVRDSTNPYFGFVNAQHPLAAHPEQLFVDGVPRQQVASLGEVRPGTFFVDLAGSRLYMGDNPGGRSVRASDLTMAVNVYGAGSVLRGFGVMRYATSVPQLGTVRVLAANVTLENMVVNDNATQGVFLKYSNVAVRHLTAQGNGMMGLNGSYLDGLRMSGVRVSGNNDEHFNPSPSAGGFKITRSRNIAISDSVFSGNDGSGVWMDEANNNATIVRNDLLGNAVNGVSFEISATGTFADNVMAGNGGVGLKINNSSNVSIWNNTLVNNTTKPLWLVQDGRTAYRLGPILLRNNIVSRTSGYCLMCVEDAFLHRTAGEIGVSADGDLYHRAMPASPNWLAVWASGSTNPAVYTSLAAFRSATRQEPHGVEMTGAPVVDATNRPTGAVLAVQAATAQPLDARVAALVGRPAGTRHLGAFAE